MAQASLAPGRGTHYASDTQAIALASAVNVTADANGSWVEADWLALGKPFVVEMDTSTVTGTSVSIHIEIQGADDNSGTNTVTLGAFGEVVETNDDEIRYLELGPARKKFLRYRAVVSGTSPDMSAMDVTLRPANYKLSETRTA